MLFFRTNKELVPPFQRLMVIMAGERERLIYLSQTR